MTTGVDNATGQGQAVDAGHIPFAADVCLHLRHADRLVAVVFTVLSLAQFCVKQCYPTEQAHALNWCAKQRQFDAAVTLFAAILEYLILDNTYRFARFEHCEATAQSTAIVFHAELGLFGDIRCE
ncbi:hypothetical protein D3C78_1544240 [compost metagenome]